MKYFQKKIKWKGVESFVKKCINYCTLLGIIGITLLIFIFIGIYTMNSFHKVQVVYIDVKKPAVYRTSKEFLSIGLDSSVIADGFNKFNMNDEKLTKMLKYLSPAYIRIGGNLADKLYFSPEAEVPDKRVLRYYRKHHIFQRYSDFRKAPNYTMTGSQWLNLTRLTRTAKLDVIFDLNVLMRLPDGRWDHRNAESLIKFSNDHNINVNWGLGNEPDSFRRKFNEDISATELAEDFVTLKNILRQYPKYRRSLVLGPDTTRPREEDKHSEIYLRKFLDNAEHVVDAITWHQYYLNGRTAVPENFINPEVFDFLKTEIESVTNITNSLYIWNKPIWLGETSSAYGGGAPNLSNTFIGSFMWLDKLGLAAKMGIRVVIRQSIFKGYYALLDNNYDPNPDWWISILYKKLVGPRVVPCYSALESNVRLYCHCTEKNIFGGNPPSVTVFGVNMDNSSANIRIDGMLPLEYDGHQVSTVYGFELTTADSLLSKNILLNGYPLELTENNELPDFVPKVMNSKPFVVMPPFSVVFWVVPSPYIKACI